MIGPADEYPIHQVPQPIAWPATSDRNFYDRSYHSVMNQSGDFMLATGMGYYSNLGTKDAFVVFRRGDHQIGLNLGDAIDHDRLRPRVGPYRVEVIEPLTQVRLLLAETEGIAFDLTWHSSFPVVQELPHVMRRGARPTLDSQRFTQMGTYSGWIRIDGQTLTLDSEQWLGFRDRSWGIRPVGEAEPPGAPIPFDGMWMCFAGLRFDEFAVALLAQEDPDGFRVHNDCVTVDTNGAISQWGWPAITIDYLEGTRYPSHARIETALRDGAPVHLDLDLLTGIAGHLGGGYGGAGDWGHGMWRGEGFIQRVEYDLADAAVAPRVTFGSIDHTARVACTIGDAEPVQGWGLFSHAILGRHTPSGFHDWFP